MAKIAQEDPHVLVLNGPFLFCENDIINSGLIKLTSDDSKTLSYFEYFDLLLVKILDFFLNKKTLVIIAPALTDITTFFSVPQPTFDLSKLTKVTMHPVFKNERLVFVSNPSIFNLNEIIIGNANFDSTKDLISNSLKVSNAKNPIEASLEAVLNQRNLYPLIPSHCSQDNDKIERTTTVDYRQIDKLFLNYIPDVIINSSLMNQYAKRIRNTLFVNPGQLFRGNKPGSYARLNVFPPSVCYFC